MYDLSLQQREIIQLSYHPRMVVIFMSCLDESFLGSGQMSMSMFPFKCTSRYARCVHCALHLRCSAENSGIIKTHSLASITDAINRLRHHSTIYNGALMYLIRHHLSVEHDYGDNSLDVGRLEPADHLDSRPDIFKRALDTSW
ncbi:hypothetical protein AcV5_010329 [Taiwanofungus camphoratus]|nr:hypothetical protein AcV5_010329 [Antrodia cinnamomea]